MKAFSFPAIALAGAMLLAGCSGETGGKGEGKASEDAAKAIGNMPRPQPGLYKTTVTMTGLEIPGLPPEMEGHGAGMTTTVEDCLTQADVDKGFGELVKKGQNGECSHERFTVAHGTIDGQRSLTGSPDATTPQPKAHIGANQVMGLSSSSTAAGCGKEPLA